MASERERELNHISARVVFLVTGAVIVGTSSVFARDIHELALVVIVVCLCATVVVALWIVLQLTGGGTWRPKREVKSLTPHRSRSAVRAPPRRPEVAAKVHVITDVPQRRKLTR